MLDEHAWRSRWSGRHIADKLILAGAGLCAALAASRLGPVLALALFWLSWNLLVHGHRPRLIARFYVAPTLFLLPAALLIAVSLGPAQRIGDTLVALPLPGGWAAGLDRAGAAWASVLALRAFAAYGALVFLALSTPVAELTCALGRVGLPPVLLELAIFTYRMFGLLGESTEQIVRAQRARLGYGNRARARRSIRALVPAVVARALHHVRGMASALDARGYRGRVEVLLPVRPFRPARFLGALTVAVLLVLGAGWLDRWGTG